MFLAFKNQTLKLSLILFATCILFSCGNNNEKIIFDLIAQLKLDIDKAELENDVKSALGKA
jgi:hypothetical protein